MQADSLPVEPQGKPNFHYVEPLIRRPQSPTPVLLPGESQGRGSLVGCGLWGHKESDTTDATQQQQQPQFCCYKDRKELNHINDEMKVC